MFTMNTSPNKAASGKNATGTIITVVVTLVAAVASLFLTNPISSRVPAISNFINGTPLINNGSFLGISNFHVGTLIVAVVIFAIMFAVIMILKIALGGSSSAGKVGASELPERSVNRTDRPNIKRKR
jgi:lipoprotein signal peptidase